MTARRPRGVALYRQVAQDLTARVDRSELVPGEPLDAGMLAGSSLGLRVARRLPVRLLRLLIVLIGSRSPPGCGSTRSRVPAR